jgi:hypothetical protein
VPALDRKLHMEDHSVRRQLSLVQTFSSPLLSTYRCDGIAVLMVRDYRP